ncbi:MAG: rRNA maturation RNase YbeY [Anaerolineaceae bacterium]|nr:rRNA maturation RNase YbeY [Anaerolineaceae bacterium]
MINIIFNPIYKVKEYTDALSNAVRLALAHHDISENDIELSVVIETDEKLRDLNYQYRGIDAPTDVLSFSSDLINPETGKRYLGDVVISHMRAEAQADAGNHSITEECQMLVVHGILHLLGHDHIQVGEKKIMWEKKKEILKKLGLNIEMPE